MRILGVISLIVGVLLIVAERLSISFIQPILGNLSLFGFIYAFPVFLFLESFFLIFFKKRKRASMFASFFLLIAAYLTSFVYFHRDQAQVAFVMEKTGFNPSPGILIAAFSAEIVLLLVLLISLRSLDKKIYENLIAKEIRRKRREEAKEALRDEGRKEEVEKEISKEYEEDPDVLKRARKEMKKRKKEEAAILLRADRETEKRLRKEEKREKKEEKRALKKGSTKETVNVSEEEEKEALFSVTDIPEEEKKDPFEPVVFPDIAEIPKFDTITPSEIEKIFEFKSVRPREEFEKEKTEEIDTETEEEDEETENEYEEELKDGHFKSGGMLEATIEAFRNSENNPNKERHPGPIKGFYEDDRPTPEKPAPSFAPSNLSPDHPRYKLFEALIRPRGRGQEKPSVVNETYSEDNHPSAEKEDFEEYDSPKKTYDRFEQGNYSDSYGQRKTSVYESVNRTGYTDKTVNSDDKPEEIEGEQGAEFIYSVGIAGLSSNVTGMKAIRDRARRKYIVPSDDVLIEYPSIDTEVDDYAREIAAEIIRKYAEFKTELSLLNITRGPSVTLYEFKLKEGTSVSKVASKNMDLKYALGVDARILAPVPGRQAVGVEVPNAERSIVGFKELLAECRSEYKYKKMHVPMILGRAITGEARIIDLAKMPHILIAGTTGSGKSVCVNSFICTILYTKSPKEVRFIMVDPKTVELSQYNGIPHLLTSVISETKKVKKALDWLCDEMDRRYAMLTHYGARQIDALNQKISEEHLAVEKLPYIVLIIDEFADLMAQAKNDLEIGIGRLAAKARAAGIHLVLATQRPSVDVVTGTLKSNIPARIAFQVSSGINSRVILDELGAENLLGKGDMLLMDPTNTFGVGFQRIQGALLSDSEIYDTVRAARVNNATEYLSDDLFEDRSEQVSGEAGEEFSDEDSDEALYERAKEICFERGNASASYLQRKMKIGYNRAARLIEMMEEDNIIGPPNGSKPREILRYE